MRGSILPISNILSIRQTRECQVQERPAEDAYHRGGSRYEKTINGKARVKKTTNADINVATSAALSVSGVIGMSPFRF